MKLEYFTIPEQTQIVIIFLQEEETDRQHVIRIRTFSHLIGVYTLQIMKLLMRWIYRHQLLGQSFPKWAITIENHWLFKCVLSNSLAENGRT